MSNIPEYLPNPKPNLGSDSALDRWGIDSQFQSLANMPHIVCIVCSQPASYRLIPKSGVYPNAHLEDKAYVCSYHVSQMDNTTWGLRALKDK